jgi:hypothetical protein
MKTLEFEAPLGTDRTLTVPAEIAALVDRERPVRVILVQRDDEDTAWTTTTAEQFLAGYDEGDAIYDHPPTG